MVTLTNLYEKVEHENIGLFDYNWKNKKAIIIKYQNHISIGIDYSRINNSIEEREILAEELGHYYCNATYNCFSSTVLRRKNELRAMKWAYSILVPYKKLKEKIQKGLNIYELADNFDVDINYMTSCINFYISKYGNFN